MKVALLLIFCAAVAFGIWWSTRRGGAGNGRGGADDGVTGADGYTGSRPGRSFTDYGSDSDGDAGGSD